MVVTWNKLAYASELPHATLSATHTDTTAAALVRGDLLVAIGATPKLTRYALSAPAANLINVLGVVNGETEPTWKALLDATNPATLTVSAAAAPGTATIAAHRDHVHPITSSSNPGAAAAILATNGSGLLTLAGLTITGDYKNYRNATTYTGYIFVPMATIVQVVGGPYSTSTDEVTLDLSTLGLPAGVKAVSVRMQGACPTANAWIALGVGAANPLVVVMFNQVSNLTVSMAGIVPCDANGDIYLTTSAAPGSEFAFSAWVTGYWI